MFNKIKSMFGKGKPQEEIEEIHLGSDSTMLPSDWVPTNSQITTSEALEVILNKLDIIEDKLDKL